jgi:penicillin-binding protein 2
MKRRRFSHEIDPDEVLLDAHNLPQFDKHRFQGRLERPLGKSSGVVLAVLFLVIGGAFVWRLFDLQGLNGDWYVARAENNRLEHTPIFPARGVITDRDDTELVWNVPGDDYPTRVYADIAGLSHILGYVQYPEKDDNGFYYRRDTLGMDGVEYMYQDALAGIQGVRLVEVDVHNTILSESVMSPPVDGDNLKLSIDAHLQEKLAASITELANQVGFAGGAAILMDVENGEVLALVSMPEYDSMVMSEGENADMISEYNTDKRTPFVNRAVAGLYTPGSTVKPFMGAAALEEKTITPLTSVYSSGQLVVPNPYGGPDTVFRDWKAFNEWFNVRTAIAWSSDVFFYVIGGGFGDQEGLGIARIKEYAEYFGLAGKTGIDLPGEKEGVIPDPEWKEEVFGEEWRVGNTYHTSIGQYGFQLTPIELVRGIAAIANGGTLVSPHVVKEMGGEDASPKDGTRMVPVSEENLRIVREGMRAAVESGTASGLNVDYVDVAAKTGTAELGVSKDRVNSWVTGFFPYDEPKYAFTVLMESGPRENTLGGVYVMRQFFDWMYWEAPEYLE